MKKSLPLTLSIRSAFPLGMTSSSSAPLTPAMRSKVLARDDFTCAYCGFQSQKFQEVRPADANGAGRPGRADDWVTGCHMCDQCLSLERVGMMGEGILIWLPELPQLQLNHLVRALYVARSGEGEMAEAARRGLDSLRARRDEAKRRLGTDDPLLLATIFADTLSETEYQNRADKLQDIRLLSLDRRMQRTQTGEVDRFPDMLAFWKSREGPFGRQPPSGWRALLDQFGTPS